MDLQIAIFSIETVAEWPEDIADLGVVPWHVLYRDLDLLGVSICESEHNIIS